MRLHDLGEVGETCRRDPAAAGGYAENWYTATTDLPPPRPALAGERRCDIAVVGAGLTGLSSALHLARLGREVVVLEAVRAGWAASGRSGGQLIHGYACDITRLEKLCGPAAARQYWAWSIEALDLARALIADEQIDCDAGDGTLNVAIKPRQVGELRAWRDHLKCQYGYELKWLEGRELGDALNSPRYLAGLYDRRSLHLHPLQYTLGLARAAERAGAVLYEQSRVTHWRRDGGRIVLATAGGRLLARQVIFCGNTGLDRLVPRIRHYIMPVGTYISATEALDPALAASLIPSRAAVSDTNFVLDYFRLARGRHLLFGGRVSYSTLKPPLLAAQLRRRMTAVFPQLAGCKIVSTWGGEVDITMNRAPHFGHLADNVHFMQGFSGHGMALAGLAGKLVAEKIGGLSERFDQYCRIPHHPFPGGRWLRTPALVMAMAWYRLRDWL